MSHQGLFVAAGAACHQLDRFTGETLRTFNIPPAATEGSRIRKNSDSLRAEKLNSHESNYEEGHLWGCVDLADCGGNQMMGLAHDGVLLFGEHFPDAYYHNPRKRMAALATSDGRQLWTRETNNTTRPLIVGDTIHASPYAFALKTGAPQYMKRNGKVMMQKNAKTGQLEPRWKTTMIQRGCGPVTCGSHAFFYRSSGAIALDESNQSTEVFAATRPGCWINMIPTNGVLFQAEASSGCVCNYSIQSTVVYAPEKVSQHP
ncbi:MAG: hypothetical protein CMJ78_22595 [Planctomycetaceae bacterium]|nr:hypothetical protein [Planctomycetaceae bacterium]